MGRLNFARAALLGGVAAMCGTSSVIGTSSVMAADLKILRKAPALPRGCAIFGEGFTTLIGSPEVCAKAGFWLRADGTLNGYPGDIPFIVGPGAAFANGGTTEPLGTIELRGGFSDDLRIPTSYAPVRIYIAANAGFFNFLDTRSNSGDISGVASLYVERAFIQFSGFTVGKSQSYFDFLQVPNASYWTYHGASATGASGTLLAAYTAPFGNGISATIAAEDSRSRRNAIWDAGTNGLALGAFPGPNSWGFQYPHGCLNGETEVSSPLSSSSPAVECAIGDYAAQSIPDIVSSLRVDQAWGSAQISGALHQVRGNFYGNNSGPSPAAGPAHFTGVAPSDAWGWAVNAGIVLNLPWNPGDTFWVEGVYSQGAPCYTGICQQGYAGTFYRFNDTNVAAGWALDGVFANTVGPAATGLNGSGLDLSTAGSISAAVEHYWTPALRTSLFGSFTFWNPGAKGNDIMCSSPVGPVRTLAGAAPNFSTGPVQGCDFSFDVMQIGQRSVWNPVKNLDIGLEVMYTQLHTNFDPGKVRLNFGGAGGRAAGLYVPADEGVWSGMLRVQRNFWP